jgi:hypothetical protein
VHPLIAVVVVLLALVVVYLLLGALHVIEPWRSVALVVAVVLGILYLVGGVTLRP